MEVDDNAMVDKQDEVGSNDTVMKHNLPQIPSSVGTNPRMAVSKASVKGRTSPTKQFANLVSMEELNKVADIAATTPVKGDPTKPPSSMPTPPSDGTPSEHSPKTADSTATVTETAVDAATAQGITDPVNPKSTISHTNQQSTEEQKRTPRAKTKGDIKKQLMKKKGQKSDAEKKEESGKTEKQPELSIVEGEGCQYMLGDMFWGKVSGHPWWPCMIAYDPYDTIYFKTMGKGKSYHVQFFGQEGERGWVSESRLELYKGKQQHLEWLKLMYSKNKSRKKEFEIKPSRRPAWDIACVESEEAFKIGRTERRARFTLSYSPLKKKETVTAAQTLTSETGKKAKRKLSIDGSDRGDKSSPPKKRRKRTKSSSLSPTSKDSEKLANQKLTQFMVFCSKKRDSVRREHPTYLDSQIEKCLKDQWDEMTEEQKSKFIPMGSDVKNVSQLLPEDTPEGAKRMPKPSKKKMESEETGGIIKRRKSSVGHPVRRRSDVSPCVSDIGGETGGSVDSVIDSVAAGAGEIPSPDSMDWDEDMELVIDEDRQKKKKVKKDVDTDHDDSSSVSSGKEDNGMSKSRTKFKGIELESGQLFEPEIFKLVANPAVKKENICSLCEELPGEVVNCEGPCCGTFHVSCLGLKKPPSGLFKCDECMTGLHTCFVCKNTCSTLKRCSISGCGKFYHLDCLKKFNLTRIEKGNITCPLHTCATCAADNPKDPKACKGRFYQCVRCPTAYHISDFCIAAGSMNLAGQHIVCSRHFQPNKSQSHHSHVNVSWCFLCSKGGSLLCCETCPASFHVDCLKIDPPEGAWYCRECASGKKPLYGDIIWVKIGNYRWWPGEVCHPRNVPTNIQEKSHQVGEFPVHFFGSGDYFWLHQARVFLFQEGDKGCKESATSKRLSEVFQKAQKEGALAYNMWKEFQEKREEKQQEINERKPAPYKHIKTNQPVGSVTIYKADPAEIPRCECHPAMENPCGDYSDCINRMTLEECHPAVCPAGDRCQNQRFQKREYAEAVPVKCSGRGWGLKALINIRKGQFVNEYVGELVDEVEAKRRFKQAEVDNIINFYMLTLDTKRIIDAGPKGNLSRFMNHSCAPNCVTQKWTVNGDVRVGLFANNDIAAGTELTFNYNLDCLGNEKRKCACGALTCSGYLGVKAKKEEPVDKPKMKKKKKLKKQTQKVAEDECYRCGDGGELVVCDKGNCTKVYHLKCLKLTKMPHGKWLCPWHHCDDCGKPSIKLCSECPNSFCNHHIEGNIFQLPDSKLVCSDHDDILEAVEASKLENEPNAKVVMSSSSEATSTCSSSPAHSDSEASASESVPSIDDKVITASSNDNKSNGNTTSGKKGRGRSKKSVESTEDILQSTSGSLLSPKGGNTNGGELPNTPSNNKNDNVNDPDSKTSESSKKRKRSVGKKSVTPSSKGNNKIKENGNTGGVGKAQTFEDTDSDEFPNLVIDIP